MSQVAQIEKCFGQLYCKVQQMACVGRNSTKEQLLLDKLYIAYWISCGEDCDIECFLLTNCAHCKPTKNTLPPVQTTPCCGITSYAYISDYLAPSIELVSVTDDIMEISFSGADFTVTTSSLSVSYHQLNVSTNLESQVYVNTTPPPYSGSFSAQGSFVLSGLFVESIVTFTYTGRTSEGMICMQVFTYLISYNTDTREVNIVDRSVGGPISFVGDCDTASFSSGNGGSLSVYGIATDGGENPLPVAGNQISTTTDALQLGFVSNGKELVSASSFWANCSGKTYATMDISTKCGDSLFLLSVVAIGFNQLAQGYFEFSSNGIVWDTIFQGVPPNWLDFNAIEIPWDKIEYMPGTTLYYRARVDGYGVVVSGTTILPVC